MLINHEIEESIEQLNIQQAMIGAPQYTLRACLELWNRGRLSALAKAYKIPGRSKMSKEEQLTAIEAVMKDPKQMATPLLILDEQEGAVFQDAYSVKELSIQRVPYGYYRFLLEHGFVFTFFHEGQVVMVMPEEVRDTYTRLNDAAFRVNRKRMSLIFKYLTAMTHFYGLFTVERLTEMFNQHHPSEPVNLQQMEEAVSLFLLREQEFVKECGFVVDSSLVYHAEEEGELEQLIAQTAGIPHYVPEQEILMNYTDGGYFEMTPQLMALKAYVQDRMACDEVTAEDLVDDIQLVCTMEEPLEELLYEFERRDIMFKDKRQGKEVLGLLKDIQKTTRLWRLSGHTLKELERPAAMASVKPGRNEPCPCGSGLKYKKCCGKG